MIGGNSNPMKYDYVIGNPPYMKIPKDAPEATAMPEICYGAPNMYFIFADVYKRQVWLCAKIFSETDS